MVGLDFGVKHIYSSHLELGRLVTRESIPCLSDLVPCLVPLRLPLSLGVVI